MQTYRFTLTLGQSLSDDDYDRLFDLGLADCTLGTERGKGLVIAARKAADYDSAVRSVTEALGRAGLSVTDATRDEPEGTMSPPRNPKRV